jgi:hypothetical protein
MLRSTMPRFDIIALLNPPQEKDTSFMALRLQPATIGSRLPHTYLVGGAQEWVSGGRAGRRAGGGWVGA